MTLSQARILAVIAMLVFSHGLFYNFGHTAAKSKCTTKELKVAEKTIKKTVENIEAHNESAEKNKIHRERDTLAVAKAAANIIQLPNVSLDSPNCSAGANIRMQQATYNQFPTSLFLQ